MRHQSLFYFLSVTAMTCALNLFTATILMAMDPTNDCKHPAPHVASTATAAAGAVTEDTAASGSSVGAVAAVLGAVAEDTAISGRIKDALAAISKAAATGAYPPGPASRALTMKVMLEKGILVYSTLPLKASGLLRFSTPEGDLLKPKIDFLGPHRPKFLEPHGHPKFPPDSHVITLMRLKSGEHMQSHTTKRTSGLIGYVRFLDASDLSADYKLVVKLPEEPFLFRAIKWKCDTAKTGVLEFPTPLSEQDFDHLIMHASRCIKKLHEQDIIHKLKIELPRESTCLLDSDDDEGTATSPAKAKPTKDKFRITHEHLFKYFPAAIYAHPTPSGSGGNAAVQPSAPAKKSKG